MLIDTHAHMYWDTLINDIDDILTNMKKNNITHSIQIGCDIDTTVKAINLAKDHSEFRATVGYHPTDCQNDENIEGSLNKLEDLLIENKDLIVAVGETGLDYYHTNNKDSDILEKQKSTQFKSFELQVKLANKYNLPVIIHSRNAPIDTFNCLKKFTPNKIIFHCFSEDYIYANRLIQEFGDNIMISFSGIVTYKNALGVQETASKIPLQNILIETDSPFLSPQIVRGTINNSNNVKYVLDKIIELRLQYNPNETPEIIENQIYNNSLKIYNL